MNWRKWNRIIHRDFGYFFTGVIIIYALSGIALNHRNDWNPNYSVSNQTYKFKIPNTKDEITKNIVFNILKEIEQEDNYKKYYFQNSETLKVFLKDGSLVIDINTGEGMLEILKKRPIFYQANYLHYNPQYWWTWFSDIFSACLIIISISGLLIIRGKNGITGRGAWLTGIGILIPILFLIFL